MCVYIYIWSKPEEILSCSHENCPTCMRVHYLRTTEHVHESTQTRVRHSFIVSKSSVHCLNKILSLSLHHILYLLVFFFFWSTATKQQAHNVKQVFFFFFILDTYEWTVSLFILHPFFYFNVFLYRLQLSLSFLFLFFSSVY